jgi:hypothetical protein
MSPFSNIWRQLVQRRLWPVAVLLIAALAAVPFLLAKEPEAEPAPLPKPTADATASELATTPIVAKATPVDRAKRRKVLGKAKNPFAKPPKVDAASTSPQPAPSSDTGTGAGSGGPTKLADNLTIIGGGGGGATAPGPTGPAVPAPDEPADPKPVKRQRHSVTVRFGGGESLERMNIKKLEPLPLGEEPLVVYLGVADGGKSAVFLVDSSITAQGDGECMPDASTCEKVYLREGETEFFDIVDESGNSVAAYQLDLVEIHGNAAKSSSAARTSDAKAGGLGALQDRAEDADVTRTAEVALVP